MEDYEKAVKFAKTSLQHPFINTPDIAADLIRPMIQDKIVCDVGCRAAVFMKALGKYAKEVIGVENNQRAIEVGRECGGNIIEGNAATMDLPDADVYYVWVHQRALPKIVENIRKKKGIIIIGNYPPPCEESTWNVLKDGIRVELKGILTESGYKKDWILTILDLRPKK